MIVEVYGAKFVNKGAELMLVAIQNKILERYPHAEIVLSCGSLTEFRELEKRGYKKKLTYRKNRFLFRDLGFFLPKSIRKKYGIVLDREVDVVFEASGFAYGDQWTARMAKFINQFTTGWKKNGTKVVFMPQAFGPFKKKAASVYIREALNDAYLIYARDTLSFEYVQELNLQHKKVKQSPDFTMILSGVHDSQYDWCENKICIIPNNKVVSTSSDPHIENKYIEFFRTVISHFKGRGTTPFILIHEGILDYRLAEKISNNDPDIKLVWEKDPLKIKGIIGRAKGVIGSRFHGLVSSLSQGIPSYAIGWSHKYEMLFSDFGVPNNVLSLDLSSNEIIAEMEKTYSDDNYKKTRNDIEIKSGLLKQQIHNMWDEIFVVLES